MQMKWLPYFNHFFLVQRYISVRIIMKMRSVVLRAFAKGQTEKCLVRHNLVDEAERCMKCVISICICAVSLYSCVSIMQITLSVKVCQPIAALIVYIIVNSKESIKRYFIPFLDTIFSLLVHVELWSFYTANVLYQTTEICQILYYTWLRVLE